VLLIAAGIYFFTPIGQKANDTLNILTMPSELKDATFISDKPNGATSYRISGLSFVSESIPGILVSAEKSSARTAQILENPKGTYMLSVNGKAVYSTTTPLMGVTLTPDGSRAIVAAQLSGKEGIPAPVYFISPGTHPYLWTDFLLHLDGNGGPLAIGNGTSPIYLDATHILRIAPVGLVSVDMGNGAVAILVPQPVPVTISAVLVSANRSHMAVFDPKSRSIMVYKVTPQNAGLVATMKAPSPVTSYFLGNDALYILQNDGKTTDIAKETFGAATATIVARLPQSMDITRVLIGSL
jgi:hypothetical protein